MANLEIHHKHLGQMEVTDYRVIRNTQAGLTEPGLDKSQTACERSLPQYQQPADGSPTPNVQLWKYCKVLDYEPMTRVVLGAGVDERLAFVDIVSDNLQPMLINHQGSLIGMTDAQGRLAPDTDGGRYVYDAYGKEGEERIDPVNQFRRTARR